MLLFDHAEGHACTFLTSRSECRYLAKASCNVDMLMETLSAFLQVQNVVLAALREACGSSIYFLFNRIQSVRHVGNDTGLVGIYSYTSSKIRSLAEVSW